MVLARVLPRAAVQQTRAFAAVRAKHTLPPLPYAYDVSHCDPPALVYALLTTAFFLLLPTCFSIVAIPAPRSTLS